MRFFEQLRSVFLSILSNKSRVVLTSLGIIIGTFTIIMVVGIGKASQAAVAEEYKRLSVESITITRTQMRMAIGPGVTQPRSFTKSDAELMPELLQHVKSVGVSTSTNADIIYGQNSTSVYIQGINEDYADITHLDLLTGEFFTDEDGINRNRYAVLGYNVAQTLFGEDFTDAIGETVKVKGLSFTVVGILQRVGGSGGVSSGPREGSVDDSVFVPYEIAVKYATGGSFRASGGGNVFISSAGGAGGTTFVALANDMSSVQLAVEEIKEYIAEICGDDSSYSVTDVGATLTSAMTTSNTMSVLLITVAAIVLLVSGIGIMNVLMVAVSERTREIGILKSLGAKRSGILTGFLLEAIFISVVGGLLGVGLSVFAPNVLSLLSVEYLASAQGLMLGLGFSVLTGIFFGYYPALKASKLKPIDALNAE